MRQVRQAYGVSRRVFSRLASFSERSIAAWESGDKLSGQGRQRMAELHRLQEALAQVMDARFIASWLETPNPAFQELKPLEVIERGQIDRIWRMIFELQSGVPG